MAGPERGGVRHAGGRIMLIALTRTRDDRDNRDRRFWAWWPGDPDLGDLERDTVLFSTMSEDDRVPHQQGLGRQLKAFSICVQKRVSADPAGQGCYVSGVAPCPRTPGQRWHGHQVGPSRA